jgi:uncharacterized protein YcbX
MRVAQVWRYPVKSMQGESLTSLDIELERVPGDREWGVRDSTTGVVLNARTDRALLRARSASDGEGVRVTLPDGRELRDGDEHTDLALSAFVGRAVQLVRAKPDEQAAFETPAELSGDPTTMVQWQSRPGSFNDGHLVHVLTTASLRAAARLHPDGAWDARRFRPNVLLDVDGDDFVEDGWTGLTIGDVELEVYKRTTRCVLTSRAQADLPDDMEVPRSLARNRNAKLGVYARVHTPGTIDAGADVRPA